MLIELLMFNKIHFFSSFVSNMLVNCYNNYLGCLDISYQYLYAVFKVHKDASTWKTIVCDKLACLSIIAFSCIGM